LFLIIGIEMIIQLIIFFGKFFTYLRNKVFRKNQLTYIKEIKSFKVSDGVKFIKIEPRQKLGMGRFEINNQNARRVFQLGFDDTNSNKNLFSL